MVQLGLIVYFKHKIIGYYGAVVPMKYPGLRSGQYNHTKHNMRDVFMCILQNHYPQNNLQKIVKILGSIYEKEDLDEVSSRKYQLGSE